MTNLTASSNNLFRKIKVKENIRAFFMSDVLVPIA
jgi:hypothetical protein